MWPVLACVAALGLGLVWGRWWFRPAPRRSAPTLVEKVREVTRLESLEVSLYKKISFAPEPVAADSLWDEVGSWARHTFASPRARAIVFADVHYSFDLMAVNESSIAVTDDESVTVTLPPVTVRVELKPGETELINSNLDAAETARLFELARSAFEREALSDPRLRERAVASAERSIRSLFIGMGYREVRFVRPAAVEVPK